MDWITTLYWIGCTIIVLTISLWLHSRMLRSNGKNSLWAQLAVLGFALITSGTTLQLNHPSIYPPALAMRLLDAFGILAVVAGVIVLFILFCISRGMPLIAKPTPERETFVGEYLR